MSNKNVTHLFRIAHAIEFADIYFSKFAFM